jgi:hypothetical protein
VRSRLRGVRDLSGLFRLKVATLPSLFPSLRSAVDVQENQRRKGRKRNKTEQKEEKLLLEAVKKIHRALSGEFTGLSNRCSYVLLLRGRLLRRSCVRKIQSVDQEFFELLSVGVRPFLPSPLPRKLAAFFTFDPLVLPDLFFDKVGNPVERIGIHYGRDRNVFFSL